MQAKSKSSFPLNIHRFEITSKYNQDNENNLSQLKCAFLIRYWSSMGIDLDQSSQNKTASMIYKYIEAHYMDELSPYKIARQFNISYSGLAKAIQKYNHTTFIQCVNQIRIENAKKLLALTDKSITEIGLECGFSVTSYFIKVFHQLTNMTPRAYRDLLK